MKIFAELRMCLILFSFFMCNIGFTLGLSCKDENNNDVDWFINYKLPKISTEAAGSKLHNGSAYAYISPKEVPQWVLSNVSIESENSMMGRTWNEFADGMKKNDTSYMFYNDASPKSRRHTSGHLKGIVAFDSKTGFWLLHTVPNFGVKDKYEYPSSGLIYGQTAICVTFPVSILNILCEHLLLCGPNIYEKHLANNKRNLLSGNEASLFSRKPKFARKPPFVKSAVVKSLGEHMFYIFSKDNQYEEDIYSDVIAPTLKTSLLAETWRNGAGGILDPYCGSEYSVNDVSAIKMKVANRNKEIRFNSKDDHSKWAVSVKGDDSWVCLSDLNRMNSQAKRGGGAICFKSREIWKAFNSMIFEVDLCPNELKSSNSSSSNTTQSSSNGTMSWSFEIPSSSNGTMSWSFEIPSSSNMTSSSSNITSSSSNITSSSSNITSSSSNTTTSSPNGTISSSNETSSSANTTPSSSYETPGSANTTPSPENTTLSSSNTTQSSSNTTLSSSNTTPSSSNVTTSSSNMNTRSSNVTTS